jgi:hypothetical protein
LPLVPVSISGLDILWAINIKLRITVQYRVAGMFHAALRHAGDKLLFCFPEISIVPGRLCHSLGLPSISCGASDFNGQMTPVALTFPARHKTGSAQDSVINTLWIKFMTYSFFTS